MLKRLSYLPVGNHSPRDSRVSIPWLWLVSWESSVGSHTNRFGCSSLGLCLCICETSLDVLPAAKDSPYWDLREGPLTEITSMSDFNPCIFLVILNVVSSLAQSRVYEDHYLEWVQTEEDTDIWQVLHLFQVKDMNVTSEVREFQLVKGTLTWVFKLFITFSSFPPCIHATTTTLTHTWIHVCIPPEWQGRKIKSCESANQSKDFKYDKWSGLWLSKTLGKAVSMNIIKSN